MALRDRLCIGIRTVRMIGWRIIYIRGGLRIRDLTRTAIFYRWFLKVLENNVICSSLVRLVRNGVFIIQTPGGNISKNLGLLL